MITIIFKIVATLFSILARICKRSYNEINIIVYYFVIPFSWLWMLDSYFKFHFLKLTFMVFTIGFSVGCRDFKTYSDCLFQKSVVFLKYFNRIGSNYHFSSVLICVVIPILIYGFLYISCCN